MKQVQLGQSPMNIDYGKAMALADEAVSHDKDVAVPVLMAWYDRKSERMSPAIAGADIRTRWHDYGASHGGQVEVDIAGDYAFIYADASGYEPYGPSPYVNLHDDQGNEYICQLNRLEDPHRPNQDACMAIDEWTSKLT